MNTEGAIKNGQSKETGEGVYMTQNKAKKQHICVGQSHHYAQANTNNVNKTTGGKDEHSLRRNRTRNSQHGTLERKDTY